MATERLKPQMSLGAPPFGRAQCELQRRSDGLSALLLDLALWRSLGWHLAGPFRRAVALFLLSGGSSLTLLQWAVDIGWKSVGWLSASPGSDLWPLRRLARLLPGLRRWHLAAGGPPRQGCCLSPSRQRPCPGTPARQSSALPRPHTPVLGPAWAAHAADRLPCAAVLLVVGLSKQVARRVKEASDARLLRMKACLGSMAAAATYLDWSKSASELEQLRAGDARKTSAQFRRQVRPSGWPSRQGPLPCTGQFLAAAVQACAARLHCRSLGVGPLRAWPRGQPAPGGPAKPGHRGPGTPGCTRARRAPRGCCAAGAAVRPQAGGAAPAPPAARPAQRQGGRHDLCRAGGPAAQPGQHDQQVRSLGSSSACWRQAHASGAAGWLRSGVVAAVLTGIGRPRALTRACACSELHENFSVVPEPIRLYIEEVKLVLQSITELQAPGHGLHEKLNFLRETRHAFGRTAVVLSGGGGARRFPRGGLPGGLGPLRWAVRAALQASCGWPTAARRLQSNPHQQQLHTTRPRRCLPAAVVSQLPVPAAQAMPAAAGRGQGAAREQPAPAGAGRQQRRLHRRALLTCLGGLDTGTSAACPAPLQACQPQVLPAGAPCTRT